VSIVQQQAHCLMREITLKVPDKKFAFFMELMANLGFEVADDTLMSEEHKNLVRERIKSSKEEDLLDWDQVKNDFDGI
jgi:hypothetical protein